MVLSIPPDNPPRSCRLRWSRSRSREEEKGLGLNDRSMLCRISAPLLVVVVRRGEDGWSGRGVSGRLMPGCSIHGEGERRFGEMGGGGGCRIWDLDWEEEGDGERRRMVFVWGRRRSAFKFLARKPFCMLWGKDGKLVCMSWSEGVLSEGMGRGGRGAGGASVDVGVDDMKFDCAEELESLFDTSILFTSRYVPPPCASAW